MKFVSTSESLITRANMAYIFLKDAVAAKRVNEISNMEDVLEALNPLNVIDGFLEDMKKRIQEDK